MALYKSIMSKSGVEMTYWKIDDWKVNMLSNTMQIFLAPYLSQEAREAKYSPINEEVKRMTISGEDYENTFSPAALDLVGKSIYKVMYDYIKANHRYFKDAEDI